MNTRDHIYRELVKNDHPERLEETWRSLDLFRRTQDMDVRLKPHDIVKILLRYLSGNLSEKQVEDWANFLAVVSFEIGGIGDEKIVDAIHDLANPALEGPLTRESAQKLISRLQKD